MHKNYSIKLAFPAQLGAIPAIEQAAAQMFPESDLPLELRYLVTEKVILREAMQDENLWVATGAENTPVGFAMMTTLDGNAHLDEMDVLPAHMRNGIGRRLLKIVVSQARDRGFRSLTLITFRHLSWNAPFYARAGFAVVDPANYGDDVRKMLMADKAAGLDIGKRIVMSRNLQ